jgi:hypothetical protein
MNSPERMAMAGGCCRAAPWPIPGARGKRADLAAGADLAMGRRRLFPAGIRASTPSKSPGRA